MQGGRARTLRGWTSPACRRCAVSGEVKIAIFDGTKCPSRSFSPCCPAYCAKRPAASDLARLREALVLAVVQSTGNRAVSVQYAGGLQLTDSAKRKGRVWIATAVGTGRAVRPPLRYDAVLLRTLAGVTIRLIIV